MTLLLVNLASRVLFKDSDNINPTEVDSALIERFTKYQIKILFYAIFVSIASNFSSNFTGNLVRLQFPANIWTFIIFYPIHRHIFNLEGSILLLAAGPASLGQAIFFISKHRHRLHLDRPAKAAIPASLGQASSFISNNHHRLHLDNRHFF